MNRYLKKTFFLMLMMSVHLLSSCIDDVEDWTSNYEIVNNTKYSIKLISYLRSSSEVQKSLDLGANGGTWKSNLFEGDTPDDVMDEPGEMLGGDSVRVILNEEKYITYVLQTYNSAEELPDRYIFHLGNYQKIINGNHTIYRYTFTD